METSHVLCLRQFLESGICRLPTLKEGTPIPSESELSLITLVEQTRSALWVAMTTSLGPSVAQCSEAS
jgi:hypothetical protein